MRCETVALDTRFWDLVCLESQNPSFWLYRSRVVTNVCSRNVVHMKMEERRDFSKLSSFRSNKTGWNQELLSGYLESPHETQRLACRKGIGRQDWIGWAPPKSLLTGTARIPLGLLGPVIRDMNGEWIGGYAARLGVSSREDDEICGLILGLRLARKKGIRKLNVELDAILVVAWLTNPEEIPTKYYDLLIECRALLSPKLECRNNNCLPRSESSNGQFSATWLGAATWIYCWNNYEGESGEQMTTFRNVGLGQYLMGWTPSFE